MILTGFLKAGTAALKDFQRAGGAACQPHTNLIHDFITQIFLTFNKNILTNKLYIEMFACQKFIRMSYFTLMRQFLLQVLNLNSFSDLALIWTILDTSPDTSPISSPEPSFRPRLPTYFLSLRQGTRIGNEDFSLNSLREARGVEEFFSTSPQRVLQDSDSDTREFDLGMDTHPASFGFLD